MGGKRTLAAIARRCINRRESTPVNRDELASALSAQTVNPNAYDIFGPDDHPSEAYVIRLRRSGVVGKPDRWVTYYSERRVETGLREFETEDAACRFFLEWVTSDESAQ